MIQNSEVSDIVKKNKSNELEKNGTLFLVTKLK